uniref:ATPase inhibitor subunit zeta n=1 Tax=uncultured Sphingomonas sp. TaxID=158754 RepID=UPI0025F6E722|nr:ATPase inhibitor subunit zeta [uncultured Sphingomonas sp.]
MPSTIRRIRFAEARGVEGLADETADSPRARRDPLLGLWAARRLGMPPERVAAYCRAVMEADHDGPGDADALRELAADLRAAGRPGAEGVLREALVAAQRRASGETRHHD